MPKLPYKIILDGREMWGFSVESLVNRRLDELINSGNPLPEEWVEDVWRALAIAYPKHVRRVRGRNPEGMNIMMALGYIKFLTKLIRGKPLVSPDLAKQRAAVCSRCPKRASVMGCSVCKRVLSLHIHPPQAVKAPESCRACKCYLPLKIWVDRSLLGSADAFPFWAECWMRRESDALSGDSSVSPDLAPE